MDNEPISAHCPRLHPLEVPAMGDSVDENVKKDERGILLIEDSGVLRGTAGE